MSYAACYYNRTRTDVRLIVHACIIILTRMGQFDVVARASAANSKSMVSLTPYTTAEDGSQEMAEHA